MGQREMLVAPEMLVAFCQRHEGMDRTYTVENALPDDARFVEVLIKYDGNLALIVDSDEWVGRSEIPLEPPAITVHYGYRVAVDKEGKA